MKKTILFSLFTILLIGCGSGSSSPVMLNSEPAIKASPASAIERIVTSVTPSPTVVGTPTPNQIETAIAGTVAWSYNATSSAATATQEVKATEAFWVGVTFAVGTEQKAESRMQSTQVAGTNAANTQTAIPMTVTAIESTKQVETTQLKSKTAGIWILNVGLPIFGLVALGLICYGLFEFIRQWKESKKTENKARLSETRKPDANGRFGLLTSDEIAPGAKIINPNMAVDEVIDPKRESDLTPEQKLLNLTSRREADVLISFSQSPAFHRLRQNLRKPHQPSTSPSFEGVQVTKPDVPMLEDNTLPEIPVPPIKLLFNCGDLPVVGVNEKQQLMEIDLAKRAHLLFSGTSGSWKSRGGIRTLAATCLTSGMNVLAIGKGVDYFPFEGHDNFRLLSLNFKKEPDKLIDLLENMVDLTYKRDEELVAKRVSTWDRYGAPQTLIIIDDYSGAMLEINDAKKKKVVIDKLLKISYDGRKYGLNLVIGLQRPSWDSISPSLRSQLARICFRVERASESRIAIEQVGAEFLPALHFLTRIHDEADILRGVGFALQDVEVEAFLKSRPVKQNEPMDWVDAVVTEETEGEAIDGNQFSIVSNQPATEEVHLADETTQNKIRKIYLDAVKQKNIKLSLRMIEESVFNYAGGDATKKVKEELARLEGCRPDEISSLIQGKVAEWKREGATTVGATTAEMPNLEGMPS